MGTVYLLHFSRPLTGGNQPQHYVGHAEAGRLVARLQEHKDGRGAHITRAAVMCGIALALGNALPGSRTDERRFRRQGNLALLCVYCRKQLLTRRAANESRRRARLRGESTYRNADTEVCNG